MALYVGSNERSIYSRYLWGYVKKNTAIHTLQSWPRQSQMTHPLQLIDQ